MSNKKVMTAPLAIIRINSVAVGKMKNVRITENIRRGRVVGLGSLTPSEVPAVEWSGSLSCSSYSINFNRLANVSKKGTFRQTTSVEVDPETGMVKATYETFALVKGAFVTREGFDIQEGQISGRDTEFEYTSPILFDGISE